MYGYEELASYTSGDIRSNDSLLGLFFYEAKHTDKVILAHETRIKELEAENEWLKGELEMEHDDCSNAKKCEVEYHKAYEKELDENVILRNENAKLKCLALHLFKVVGYNESKDWGRIRDCFGKESKLKQRCSRHSDRWRIIANKCHEAYIKAKKVLMERK